MNCTTQIADPQAAGISAALDSLWARFLPETTQRVAVLESAAAAAAAGTLTQPMQQRAHAAAHKLAGVLGSFGIPEGTAPARESEHLYALQAVPAPHQAARLAALAAQLRSLIESRAQQTHSK